MMRADGNPWVEISGEEAIHWNRSLLSTDCSVFQYPYWNESLRFFIRPRYLICREKNKTIGYVCVLSTGMGSLKAGLILRGPQFFEQDEDAQIQLTRELQNWLKRKGYCFVRITPGSPAVHRRISTFKNARIEESFPFYKDLQEELIVENRGTESELLNSFQEVAIRKIRKAEKCRYVIEAIEGMESIEEIGKLFDKVGKRKGFQYRPLESYRRLMTEARQFNGSKIYTARFDGQLVSAILIIQDAVTSYYLSGALDIERLEKRESPSCLLHWQAMRDAFRSGRKFYHLGTTSGPVYQFKKQFRPTLVKNPPPVTWVFSQALYAVWRMFLPMIIPAKPLIRSLLTRKR